MVWHNYFCKITKIVCKADSLAGFLAKRDHTVTPVAATLQRKSFGGVNFVIVTKIISKYHVWRNSFVIISARMVVRVNEQCADAWRSSSETPCSWQRAASRMVLTRHRRSPCLALICSMPSQHKWMADKLNFRWSQIQNYMAEADADVIPAPCRFQITW